MRTASQIIAALTLLLEDVTGEKVILTKEQLDQFNTKHPTKFIQHTETGSLELEVSLKHIKRTEEV